MAAVALAGLVLGTLAVAAASSPAPDTWVLTNESFNVTVAARPAAQLGPQPTSCMVLFVAEMKVRVDAAHWSANLLVPPTPGQPRPAGALSTSSAETMAGKIAPACMVAGSAVLQDGHTLEVGAEVNGQRETWTVTAQSNPPAVRWKIVKDTASLSGGMWGPSLAFVSGGEQITGRAGYGAYAAQVPSILDLGMVLNETSGGCFPYGAHETLPTGVPFFECMFPGPRHEVRLSPSTLGLSIQTTYSDPALSQMGALSFAKPPCDGTCPLVTLSHQWVSPAAPANNRIMSKSSSSSSSSKSVEWTISLLPEAASTTYANFSLSVPLAPHVAAAAGKFTAVHNQWLGYIMGNNPASSPCLHEMYRFVQVASVFGVSPENSAALRKELLFFAERAVMPSGNVYPRWWSKGFYLVQWGPLQDQIPHFLLAMHGYVRLTADKQFALQVLPAVEKVAAYMLAHFAPSPFVFRVPHASGLADGGKHASNWYDIVEFGNFDAYVNMFCVMSLAALQDMYTFLGMAADAEKYQALHEQAAAGHNELFWDASEQLYHDWVDEKGNKRSYFYTDHNLLAILSGVADKGQASAILAHLDRGYVELSKKYDVPLQTIWSTPANMYPITNAKDTVANSTVQLPYPKYENGNAFFHTLGLEVAARAMVGNATTAFASLERFLAQGMKQRLWAIGLDWIHGPDALFSEPTNTGLEVLWSLKTLFGGCPFPSINTDPRRAGLFGCTPDPQRAPPQLRGAKYTYAHMGRNVNMDGTA